MKFMCNICNRRIYPNGDAIVCSCCGMRFYPIEGR